MNHDRNKRRLLNDILTEESDSGLRDDLLGQMLRQVRRQKRIRAARRVGSAAMLSVLAALLAVHFVSPRPSPVQVAQPPPERGYALIHTQPLAPTSMVASQPFLASDRAGSSITSVAIISTIDSHPPIVELSDDQLLDLTRGTPVALVRQGPHQAELIFLSEDDREKLFHN